MSTPQISTGAGKGRVSGRTHRYMIMCRHLGNIERVGGFTAEFAESDSVPHMHGTAALQIRQAEGNSPIASVGSAQNRKQCLVLVDGQ